MSVHIYNTNSRLERIRLYVELLNDLSPERLLEVFEHEPELEAEDPLPIVYPIAEKTLKELSAPK